MASDSLMTPLTSYPFRGIIRGAMIGEISALTCALCWASSSILLKSQTGKLDSLSINALCCAFASLFFWGVSALSGRLVQIAQLPLLSLLYLLSAVLVGISLGDTLFLKSLSLIGVSRALPIVSISPLFTTFLALAFLHEELTWTIIGGIGLTTVGVYVVASSQEGLSREGNPTPQPAQWLGLTLALLAAFCWSIGIVTLKPGLQGVNVFVANSVRMPFAALILTLLALRWGRIGRIGNHGWRSLTTIALAGLVGSGFGSALFLNAIQHAGAAKASSLSSIYPLLALPLSSIFLRERITPRIILGTVLSVGGIWLIL